MGDKKRVLIVEDDGIVKSSLERLLQESDCEVDSAQSGEEGLEKFERVPCDLVLTDLKLPGMDGIEMVARMRQMNNELPFVVLTAYGGADDIMRAMKLRAIDFLQKPFDIQQILNLTRKYIMDCDSTNSDHKDNSKPAGHISEVAMKTTETSEDQRPIETLFPEFIRLYRMLAPYISLGRQGTGITHNLNGPLTGMMGHLELMKIKQPELGDDLDIIMGLTKKMRDNIADLQTKLENETLPEAQLLNINQILRFDLAYLQSDLFFKHYVERVIDFQESMPSVKGVYADFALAFEEILINAVDAQRDLKNGWLKVKSFCKEDTMVVEIEDNGPGFTSDALEHAFEPYWPGMKVLESGQVHVGMGLYMSRQWLEPYGARIELQNREPKGARVRVILPLDGGGPPKR